MLKIVQNKSKRNGLRPDKVATTVAPQRELTDSRREGLATVAHGITGAILLWAAFPPINMPYLAWVAPVPWLWLVRRKPAISRWSYAFLWLAGCIHWLLMLEGIRLAHPALYAGWIALAAYLGVYLPAFIGLCRVAVHRLRFSVVIAAPVVWIGLELLRGHLITGFSM